MYSKDIIILGGGTSRLGLGRLITIFSNMPVQEGDFVIDHLGFVDYVEGTPLKPDNRLYYQKFERPYGKNYRRSK